MWEQWGRANVRKRVNSRAKTLSGAKPCVFSGNVAPGVAEVRSLFPWFRISIWESCRQKAHRAAVANRKKTEGRLEH